MQADQLDKQIFEHKLKIIAEELVETYLYAAKIAGEEKADRLFYALAKAFTEYRRIPENEDN